jgi:DNA mismatch repair protein MutL
MTGRYPVAFLFLELAPDMVDVNVHPTKSEVRFQDSQVLYRLLLSTLRNRFLSMELDSKLTIGKSEPPTGSRGEASLQQELVSWATNELQRQVARGESPSGPALFGPVDVQREAPSPAVFPPAETNQSEPSPSSVGSQIAHISTPESASRPASAAAEIRAMQVHDCYLVVETTEGITVIDQHALHERIMYEQLRRRVLAGAVEVQRLLIPITVELSSREAGVLLDQSEVLAELGLQLQDFGGNTVALTGYPTLLAKADPQTLLRDVVDLLESTGRKLERRDLIDSLLHMMSCKAAIKAGQRLSFEEMEALLAQRHLCDDHHHCPHGRPTALKLSRDELDRQFGRLG